jgi:hypothetical protein
MAINDLLRNLRPFISRVCSDYLAEWLAPISAPLNIHESSSRFSSGLDNDDGGRLVAIMSESMSSRCVGARKYGALHILGSVPT